MWLTTFPLRANNHVTETLTLYTRNLFLSFWSGFSRDSQNLQTIAAAFSCLLRWKVSPTVENTMHFRHRSKRPLNWNWLQCLLPEETMQASEGGKQLAVLSSNDIYGNHDQCDIIVLSIVTLGRNKHLSKDFLTGE